MTAHLRFSMGVFLYLLEVIQFFFVRVIVVLQLAFETRVYGFFGIA